MSQFVKEKFNFTRKKHTSSLNLPIQRCDSLVSTGPMYYHNHNEPIYGNNPYEFYNRRAKETQSMVSHQEDPHIDASIRTIKVENIRGSKTEKHVNNNNSEDDEDDQYHNSRRKSQKKWRSTIMSLLPASKRRSQNSDRIYLLSRNSDIESNYQDQEKQKKKKVTFFKTPTPSTPPVAHHPELFAKPTSSPAPGSPKPIMIPPTYPSTRPQRRWFPFFSYCFAIGTFILLVYDIFLFKKDYGTIISLSPFNIMLGPNTETLIQSGALFHPCIREAQTSFQCAPKSGQPSSLTPPTWSFFLSQGNGNDLCSIEDLCGLVPTSSDEAAHPAQYYRFITAIAIHGGLVQWVINITVLLTFGASTERHMNPFRFAFVWIVSGTFGFALASLFLKENTALMGCYGSLNGILGFVLINMYQSSQFKSNAGTFIFKLIMLIVLSGILGYLPGYNNFCHIGGFIAGILCGIVVVPTTLQFRVNKLRWFLVLLIRVVALTILVVLFYLVLSKFYSNQTLITDCTWCRYISCLPIFNMCNTR